jgi:copper chaperone CopZ
VSKRDEKMLTIPVTGMTCASCVRRVERALSKKEGVASASVNFATEKATVEYDPKATSPDDLIGTVEGAGYGFRHFLASALFRSPGEGPGNQDDHEREAQDQHRERHRRVKVPLQGPVDGQRHRLRDALEAPREDYGPPELAQGPRPGGHRPRYQRRKRQGDGDLGEYLYTARAVHHSRRLHVAVYAGKADGGLTDVKVRGDEELGHHDRRRGEAQLYPQEMQVFAEEPHPPEREQERYARGAGGQDRGDVYQGVNEPLAGELRPGQHEGRRGTNDKDYRHGHCRCLGAQEQRVQRDRRRHCPPGAFANRPDNQA